MTFYQKTFTENTWTTTEIRFKDIEVENEYDCSDFDKMIKFLNSTVGVFCHYFDLHLFRNVNFSSKSGQKRKKSLLNSHFIEKPFLLKKLSVLHQNFILRKVHPYPKSFANSMTSWWRHHQNIHKRRHTKSMWFWLSQKTIRRSENWQQVKNEVLMTSSCPLLTMKCQVTRIQS